MKALLCLLLPSLLLAGDWPCILGPDRNGHAAADETLLETWPEDGPKELWSVASGQGFAGAVTKDKHVFLFDRSGDRERLRALDQRNGQVLWTAQFPTSYRGSINSDSGPLCPPLVDDTSVFVWGASGNLHAVGVADGRTIWSSPLGKTHKADGGYFGAGNTPLLMDGMLIVNVGGRDAGMVGIDAKTGITKWVTTDERGSYSSGTAWNDKAIVLTRMSAMALDPANGKVLWQLPFGMRGPTVNGALPLVINDHLFLSASYRVGAQFHDISGNTPKQLWANDVALSSQYPTPVYIDGHLYGTHGREDFNNGVYRCIELKSGAVKWSQEGTGMTHTIAADGKLLLLSIDGTLRLIQPQPESYKELASAKVCGFSRAIPALSNGQLYLRETNDGDSGKLRCFQVGR